MRVLLGSVRFMKKDCSLSCSNRSGLGFGSSLCWVYEKRWSLGVKTAQMNLPAPFIGGEGAASTYVDF